MSGQDFTAAFTDGTALTPWTDPARPAGTLSPDDPGAPSRINPHVGHPHWMRTTLIDTEVEVTATVGTSEGPLDSELDGRLFVAWLVQSPAMGPVPFNHPAGKTSVQRFTPPIEGHYAIGLAREGGGAVILHLEAL